MATSPIYNSVNLDASKHTLNTSGSKQKFLFPKADRFLESRKKSMYLLDYKLVLTYFMTFLPQKMIELHHLDMEKKLLDLRMIRTDQSQQLTP